ncbi:RDD family protein [Anabaena sp. FACHB-1237]|uniref:RDD family protein n=1 Tax=Anabaena sp. FACHB-1237 TaxID=2692769 RepID=UPI001680563A|nr:RDD family protein [Anabaena sp. FACHB-1237]MBD2139434.1 RDD family protein [Anabaena sp. FACHB-1237]
MDLFNRIKFSTPESVELEFTLAGIGSRAWALSIDYTILFLTLGIYTFVWLLISSQLIDTLLGIFGSDIWLWLLAIFMLTSFTMYAGYFVFLETIWQGQTPGKKFAKICVIRDDGRPVGLQQSALRALLRPVDELLFIGAFLIMFNNQEKRLGDLVAGTIVIQAETVEKSAVVNISQEAKLHYQKLQEVADLSPLLPDDFGIIREYLLRRNGMSKKAKAMLSVKLGKQVMSIINLEQLPADVSADVFLEAIYLAYQKPEYIDQ